MYNYNKLFACAFFVSNRYIPRHWDSCLNYAHIQELIPITEEMHIPIEFHRFIVGQRGRWIRGLMENHDVNIVVPSAEKNVSYYQSLYI